MSSKSRSNSSSSYSSSLDTEEERADLEYNTKNDPQNYPPSMLEEFNREHPKKLTEAQMQAQMHAQMLSQMQAQQAYVHLVHMTINSSFYVYLHLATKYNVCWTPQLHYDINTRTFRATDSAKQEIPILKWFQILNDCIAKKAEVIFIMLGIAALGSTVQVAPGVVQPTSGHQNILVFKPFQRTVERVEPHGSETHMPLLNSKHFDFDLQKLFIVPVLGRYKAVYLRPSKMCPHVRGLQRSDHFCVMWSFFLMEKMLQRPDLTTKEIVGSILEANNEEQLFRLIMTYAGEYMRVLSESTPAEMADLQARAQRSPPEHLRFKRRPGPSPVRKRLRIEKAAARAKLRPYTRSLFQQLEQKSKTKKARSS